MLQKVVDGIVVIAEGSQTFTTTYGQAFYNSESNRAFVQLEYFGYMKRDPDDAGYAFWLGKLNQFGGNFVNAEMVLAFISSPEYRRASASRRAGAQASLPAVGVTRILSVTRISY